MTLADLIAGGESLTVEFKKDVCDHDLVEAVVASRADVFEALAGFGVTFTNPLPTGAAGARSVSDVAALHRRMRRAFQLARTLPDALIRAVESETANLPRSTEYVSCLISKRSEAQHRLFQKSAWSGIGTAPPLWTCATAPAPRDAPAPRK